MDMTPEYGFRVPRGDARPMDVWPNRNGEETMTLDEIKTACKEEGYALIVKYTTVPREIPLS